MVRGSRFKVWGDRCKILGARFILLAMWCAASVSAVAQVERVQADTVRQVAFGGGSVETGRGPAFFPANVLRGPDTRASDTTPSVDPREICSIGLDGEIVMGLKAHVIVDAPGADFIVFENAFRGPTGRPYAEPARVSVSRDGSTWVDFPFDSTTLAGCAGLTPTTGADPWDPAVSGGDAFDLSTIDVDSVRWIKLTDVTRIVLDNNQHPFYDPTLSGFDLDVINVPHAVRKAYGTSVTHIPRTTSVTASIAGSSGTLAVYDVRGVLLSQVPLTGGVHEVDLSSTVETCLLVVLHADGVVSTTKVLH